MIRWKESLGVNRFAAGRSVVVGWSVDGHSLNHFRNTTLAIGFRFVSLTPYAPEWSAMLQQLVPEPLAHQDNIDKAIVRCQNDLPCSLLSEDGADQIRQITEQPFSEEKYAQP